MLNKIKENQEKILKYLYDRSKWYKGWPTVGEIQEDTELTDIEVQESLEILRENNFVDVQYREKNHGIMSAKITDKGKKSLSIV